MVELYRFTKSRYNSWNQFCSLGKKPNLSSSKFPKYVYKYIRVPVFQESTFMITNIYIFFFYRRLNLREHLYRIIKNISNSHLILKYFVVITSFQAYLLLIQYPILHLHVKFIQRSCSRRNLKSISNQSLLAVFGEGALFA